MQASWKRGLSGPSIAATFGLGLQLADPKHMLVGQILIWGSVLGASIWILTLPSLRKWLRRPGRLSVFIGRTRSRSDLELSERREIRSVQDVLLPDVPRVFDSEPLRVDFFTFYPERLVLEQHSPIRQRLDSAAEHWVLWNTGTNALQNQAPKSRKITRLLLPNPGEPSIEVLARQLSWNVEQIVNDILALTSQAQSAEVSVRWFSGLPADTVWIGNPGDPTSQDPGDGWAHIETLLPIMSSKERPSFWLKGNNFPGFFVALRRAYQGTWECSDKPPDIREEADREHFRVAIRERAATRVKLLKVSPRMPEAFKGLLSDCGNMRLYIEAREKEIKDGRSIMDEAFETIKKCIETMSKRAKLRGD